MNAMADKSEQCPLPAKYRYTWPGQDEAVCCVWHGNALRNVANAIGMHLQMISLSVEEVLAGRQCESGDDLPEERKGKAE